MQSAETTGSEQQNPHHHVGKIAGRFQELIDHLRSDVRKIDDPRAKAMFETSAEVLGGLKKAFSDYEAKNEAAWR
ncbi:MAG TPA: hypothetical protein VL048_18205 [Xanthobacteraceae bacterium]|nr:hypothetical protein [Xanthobacteraceae bacterium]